MAPNSVRAVDVVGTETSLLANTRNASSIAELISTLPQSWRPALGSSLSATYRIAVKLCNVQNMLSQYERHKAEGSYPGSITGSIKEPKLQFSKEYLGTEDGSLVKGTVANHVQIARKAVLTSAITAKNEELAALQEMISFNETSWRQTVLDTAKRVAQAVGCTVSCSTMTAQEPSWSERSPSAIKMDCKVLWQHGSVFHYRACALARSLADRTLVDKVKTLNLKKEADVEMRDVDVDKPVRDVVREEMQAQMRLLKIELARNSGKSTAKRQLPSPADAPRPVKKVRPSVQEQGRLEPLSRHERVPAKEEGREEGQESLTVTSFLHQCSKDFRSWLPETYPTVYNRLSLSARIRIGVAHLRTWEAETIRVGQPGVFKQSGVTLPEDIEYSLAVNHKFILHQSPAHHDVNEAKERFCRTVRNRWFFRGKDNPDFIPKFHVANSRWKPPLASPAIERGLEAAMGVIDGHVHRAFWTIATRPAAKKFLNWAKVQEFLQDHGLLAKLTDKNLGLAVISASWYDANVLLLLADKDTYRLVTKIDKEGLIKTLHNKLPKWRLPPAMEKYIWSQTKMEVPEFHAIPKVHKTPWKLRPIVPSHSWLTTTTSEVLDHLCQPLLEHFPWVVASSKEVVNQLELVRTSGESPVWILTGDVVAFYSNIPPKPCSDILKMIWKRFQRKSDITPQAIRDMVKFVMFNNYLGYNGQLFHQINGLAMGTACAPVVANLYAAFYEHKARVVHQDGVLLYVRYIDDILCLFQGTEAQVTAFASGLSIGPLRITWSRSLYRKEFLDIELVRLPHMGLRAVHTRLYRKQMNRHLYIPWSSAHPLHVKKGFVKAELTRFTMLCSTFEYFADARKEFYGNLRRRGYPPQTLNEWFSQVHYGSRSLVLLRKKEEASAAPLMLPGHYNPVWDFVDVKEVIATARRHWSQEELPDDLQMPLIRSLGRTTSLFDLLSVWNKTTLLSSSVSG
jgi:hypothetical protein